MIVPMRKVHVAARSSDHDALLDELAKLGVMHLVPIDPAAAVADEQTTADIDHAKRAVQILAAHHVHGDAPQLDAAQAVEEVLRIHRQTSERQTRLSQLHRQVVELEIWGDARLAQFQQLQAAGLTVTVVTVKAKQVDEIHAELVHPLGGPHGGEVLVVAVSRGDALELPEDAEIHELPARDRPAVQAEANELHEAIQADTKEQDEMVHYAAALEAPMGDLQRHADYTVAPRGTLASDDLTANPR